MRLALFAAAVMTVTNAGYAADWAVQKVKTSDRVTAVETIDGKPRINAGHTWYQIEITDVQPTLSVVDAPARPALPQGALPDGRIATGTRDIVRTWLAEPTTRYDHGVLGDKIEAGSLMIETRDGKSHVVRLSPDAVFEDLEPRLADLEGDGHDEVVLVKTYLKRGSCLAVIGLRNGHYEVLAESQPLGAPHRWLDPAGIADFNGDGHVDVALVRQPHVVGALELWTWNEGRLRKVSELSDTANHIAGTRAIHMAAVADFNGDGIADLAVPSLDRTRLRIITFVTGPRELASVVLPSRAATNLAIASTSSGVPAIVVGLADGSLVVIRRD